MRLTDLFLRYLSFLIALLLKGMEGWEAPKWQLRTEEGAGPSEIGIKCGPKGDEVL